MRADDNLLVRLQRALAPADRVPSEARKSEFDLTLRGTRRRVLPSLLVSAAAGVALLVVFVSLPGYEDADVRAVPAAPSSAVMATRDAVVELRIALEAREPAAITVAASNLQAQLAVLTPAERAAVGPEADVLLEQAEREVGEVPAAPASDDLSTTATTNAIVSASPSSPSPTTTTATTTTTTATTTTTTLPPETTTTTVEPGPDPTTPEPTTPDPPPDEPPLIQLVAPSSDVFLEIGEAAQNGDEVGAGREAPDAEVGGE